MAEEKTIKKHRFLDKHTIAGVLLLMFGNFIFIEMIVGTGIAMILQMTLGLETGTEMGIGAIIGSVIALIAWFRFFSPEYRWRPQKGEWGKTFKLLSPVLLYWVLIFGIFGWCAMGIPFRTIGISSVLTAIMAGTAEEVAFREIGISYLARQWKDERRIPLMAVIPAAAFALTHITNIATDMDLVSVLLQALLTFFFGIFYSAVYLRTGNIWPLILIHSLHDILSFSAGRGLTESAATVPDWVTWAIVAVEAILVVSGFYMLRKSKRAEILALWDRKWSRDQTGE